MSSLDRDRLEKTLRSFIAGEVDYDIHKGFECGEEDGLDRYPELTDAFLAYWEAESP